jgi:preprotein translocase subunit
MISMLLMVGLMLLALWAMSRFSRTQQQKMVAEQERRTEEALVPGNWVRTRAGFYGTVVEVSGDVVTLATPLGDESLWNKAAIIGAEEPPFATEDDGSADDGRTGGASPDEGGTSDAPGDEDAEAEKVDDEA